MGVRFSVVIPARNEEAYLPRLLETVEAARTSYEGGPETIEVIVADNVSTDRTASLARSKGARVVSVGKRVIGAVRNACGASRPSPRSENSTRTATGTTSG